MEQFIEYIKTGGPRPDAQDLESILQKYPWFLTARKMLAEETGKQDPLLALHYLSYPKKIGPALSDANEHISSGNKVEPIANELPQTENDIIDSFLQKENLRIVATEQTPEDDAASESSELELSDDMLSEELACIYRAQGLNEQARQIYERLSLLYPEKSIYFAQIIGEMDNATSEKE